MSGWLAYLWLEAKRQWRDREILIFRLGLPTAIYLILTAAQGDSPPSGPGGRMVAVAALGAVISGWRPARPWARNAPTAGCASCVRPRFAPAPRWRPRSWWR
jgi:hypothetical protein